MKEVLVGLKDGKPVQHGFIGVSMSSLTPDRTRAVNAKDEEAKLPKMNGALISRVLPQSPADLGGLERMML